jgi:predicted DNA-binding transcriptional regulator AlpA
MTALPDPAVQPFLTAAELLEVLPLSKSSLYAGAADGSIPGARRVGRRLLFATASIRDWAGIPTDSSTVNADLE